MSSLLRSGSAGRGSDPSYVLALDDAKAQEIYDKFDTYSPLEQRTLGSTLRNWAEQKVAQEQEQKFKELQTIYEDVGAWWKESGGDPMDDEIVYGAANRKFIATQLGTTAREIGDLYPHERDKWFLQNFQKKPKDDTEAFNMIRESMASRKKVEESYDMITGDVALALFDQIDNGQPVDVPTLINKWKTENAETVASLPEDWEVNTLKAAGEYFTDTERMLREQGPTLQKLYAHLVKATGRKVEGAPENDPQTVEEVNALLDELAKLPPEVRQRGYGAILMAAKRQGMDEKGFFEMAAEAWPRSLNAIKTLGFTAQETEIEERVRLLESGKTVYRDPLTGGLAGQSSAALMGASGQAVRQGEPVPEEERQQMLSEAKTELERFQVLREVRDLADNRFDPVRSNLKGGIGKIAQDIFLLGPQSFVYTGMAAIPVAGPLLSGAAIYSDEYNQLRLEGFSSAQSKALAAVSAPIQTFFEVAGAKLLFGRYQWYKDLVRKLVNPARFTRTAQGTVSFFGKVVGENITEGLQDLTTPVVQDFANRLNEEIPDVDWNQTLAQWYDSRLEVFAATLMPVIGGHTVEMFTDGKRFSSAERREKLFYGPLGINQKEKRYIEDGTTPEERRKRSIEVLQAMPKERVKAAQDALAQQSQTAAVTQQDATTPTLEAQKDANGRVTYIVRDEGGKEVYRTNKQDAAEEAYILATAKSTAAQFSNDRMIVQELVSQWEASDPNNVARTGQTENAQQVLDRLTAENNTAQIEVLHRRIAQSPMAGTPLDQIQILGEATVEDVGNMVFRGVITLNESSRPQDAREEMHHVAVRRALGTNRVTLDQLREWLAASESVLETKLARDTQDDIVESLAIVQRAYEDGQIDAGRETQLPPSFVDYIKRMIAAFAEVLKRAVALRDAFSAGALPQEYEAFLAETTGVSQQEVVDRARERTEQEVGAQQNYSIGLREPSATSFNETTLPDGNVRFIAYHGSEQPLSQLDDRPIYVSSLADGAGYGDATRMVIEGRFLPVDEIEAFAAKYGIAMEDLFHEEASMEQDLQEALRSEGYDGAIYYDQRRDDGDVMPAAVIVNPNAIQVAPVANYSIVRSVDHFKNDTRFDKLVKDGRVFTGVDVNDFIDQHILLHSPDNAFAGTIQLTDGNEIQGKGGVYYPAMYADKNYFWASTEAKIMATANHLNQIGAKNGGRILMGLVSAPVEKLFSSTAMATGAVKFFNALTNDSRAGLRKSDLNAMLVAASKVEVVKKQKDKPDVIKKFKTTLKASDSYATNLAKINALLEPNNSIFEVRKAFVETLAAQVAKHLNVTPDSAKYVAGILADAENKHAKNQIKKGSLSKASIMQGLGNMLTEPFLRDFQEHGNGKIYAILEVQGEVKGIATTEHESYPATVVPVDKKSKVKLHVLKEAFDWQDVVGHQDGRYSTPSERTKLLPTGGMSVPKLKVLGVKAGSSAAPINYSIAAKNSLRVRMTRQALTDAALAQASWKDWYEEHQAVLDEFFGDYAQLFQDILSITSQAASVKANVGLALRAFGLYVRGEPFDGMLRGEEKRGFLPAVIKNLERHRENDQLQGQKIRAYKASNDGEVDQAVVDRHIAQLIFGVKSPSKAQFAKAQKILTEIANEIGWTPRQVQAALWAHSIYKSGKTPESYGDYLKKLESRGTIEQRIGDLGRRGAGGDADGRGRGRYAPDGAAEGAGVSNYSILARYEGMPSVAVEGGRAYSPIVRDLLKRRAAGEDIPREVIDQAINENFPAQLVEVPRSVAELPDRATIDDAIDKSQRDKRIDVSTIKAGEKVAIRQDVPAMTRKGVGVVTVKSKAGNSYEAAVRITQPEFVLNEKKSLRIAMGEAKGPHIVINGKWAADQSMPADLETWTQVGYNPDRHSFYYDRATMQQVTGGSEAYQIGNTVFVKDAQYGDGQISDISYSISTQSQIDRVSAAMGALDRSPLSRIKVYEKMQERFLRVMADNRETLSAMDGDLSQVRRTQILQALGELDGIISALPAEIRSKIGGYTQLAKVDPMDVFKGDQKVSEVRGMSGAIISAWMREGLNIGEAQKKTELPAGYRAERNLDPARADRAIADVFIQRINRINEVLENFLRDEYNDAAVELFKRAKPQRSGAGEKPKGKLGADVHALFDTLKKATEWSAEKAQAMADVEIMRAEGGELDPYEMTHAFMTAHLLPLFADWANADSTQRAAAVAAGLDVLNRAYRGEQQRRLAERQKRGYDRTDLSDDAGVAASDDKARQDKLKSENSLPDEFEAGMLNLVNFDQVLRYIFGDDSKVARELSNRQRQADNAKSDDIAALSEQWDTFISQLGGGTMEGQQLVFDLSRMDEEIDGVPYSQNQLMAITMMWMQPKGRQHMEGFFDSDGNPSGNWHYNQDFVNKAEAKLRPEAKAIREYLLRKYDEEYDAINKVYRKVYGLDLPKNQFYSPLVVESINAPEQAGIDPVTGAVFTAGANAPSALRSRGGAIAQPVFRDAVQTYFGHMLQMAHWKAYAQFNSEVSGILGHRDTRMVVKGKAGEQAATVLNNWLQYFRQGGNKDAANHLSINKWINRMTGNFAAISLFGRLSTLALQATQLGAASAKMPVGAYLSRFGKLMSGRLGWTTALDSDYIQRRIKDMPPAVALAMQGLRAKKPSQIRNAARWLGQHLSSFDGFFTAGTYAIVYDYQLSQARQNGMGGQEAADYAREATERIVDEIAQPTRAGARSIYELNLTNPVARAVWAFSSEARKNIALVMASGAIGGKRSFGKALTYVMLLNGLVGIVIRSAFKDMRDDDDDEIFDEKNWGWKRLAAQFVSEPIYGIPVIGETIESGIYAALGVYKPSGPVFDAARGVPAATRLVTQYPAQVLEGEAEFRDIVADVNRVLAAAGLFNSTIAGAASISNLAKDVFEIGDNALGDE